DRPETVAGERRLLEPLVRGERSHPGLERGEELAGGGKGVRERPDELLVAFEIRPADARREAPPHVGEGAGGESSADAHRARAPTDRVDVLEGVLGDPRAGRRAERPQV